MKIIAAIFMMLVFSARLTATPDDGITIHETLIGYNSESYYCIQLVGYPSGTYYAHMDSAFMIARDFNTGKIKSKNYISSRDHVDKGAVGFWSTMLSENKDFDFISFIKEHDVKYLYPDIYRFTVTEFIYFKMDMEGLKVRIGYDQEYKMVVKTNRFDQAAPWIKKYLIKEAASNKKYPMRSSEKAIKTRYFIGDGKYMFMTITGEWDAEHSEIVVAFERNEVMPVVEKYEAQVK